MQVGLGRNMQRAAASLWVRVQSQRFRPGSAAFQRFVTDNAGARLVESDILVNAANAPEPASLALVGLALAAVAATRRRKV